MKKVAMDVERLLQWAYRDELTKRATSAAEGIWDHIRDFGQRGGIEPGGRGGGGAQRYAEIGLPHPDAVAIEAAIAALDAVYVDWEHSFEAIASDLAALVTINDVSPQRGDTGAKTTVSRWAGADGAMLKHVNRPRSAIMVGSISTKALVTMHAVKGTRPGWHEQRPRPRFVPATKGPNAMVIGVCKGRNLYTIGSHCPLRYEPSPLSIILARADYAAWHAGLVHLAATLDLSAHVALPPSAAPTPWLINDEPTTSTFNAKILSSQDYMPLSPQRPRAGAPKRHPRASAVRTTTAT